MSARVPLGAFVAGWWLVTFPFLLLVLVAGSHRSTASSGFEALGARPRPAPIDTPLHSSLHHPLERLPFSFEENAGQADERVRFLARATGYDVFLTPAEAIIRLSHPSPRRDRDLHAPRLGGSVRVVAPSRDEIRLKLVGATPPAQVEGLEPLPGKTHYLKGSDPGKWRTNVLTYGKVRYGAVYPGIDLLYYGNQRQLEFDFVVAPGADPNRIRLRFEGARDLQLDSNGDLVVTATTGAFRQRRPSAYQDVDGRRSVVRSAYVIEGRSDVAVTVGDFDPNHALTIDPILYATYLGGSADDNRGLYFGTIATDSAGNAYVGGITESTDFPVAGNTYGGLEDGFLTKFDPSGAVLYSAYVGGRGSDDIRSVAVDRLDNVYVVGATQSPDFPTTPGSLPTICTLLTSQCAPRGFVIKLGNSGTTLAYSTLLGGADPVTGYPTVAEGIAIDGRGAAIVVGGTGGGLQATPGAFQTEVAGLFDGFMAKLNSTGTALEHVTYFGGRLDETRERVAVDSSGAIYISGTTASPDFPISSGAFQTTCPPIVFGGCGWIAFVMKFTGTGALVYSTYLGGSATIGPAVPGVSSDANGIAVDDAGEAYVVGTAYTTDFPTTADAFMPTNPGLWNAFVTKFSADGRSLIYSTYLGGAQSDWGVGIAIDTLGQAYVTGGAASTNFPIVDAVQSAHAGGLWDGFVAKLNAAGNALVSSTYLGGSGDEWGVGIAVGSAGTAYVTGFTQSPNFPSVHAAQPAPGGAIDSFAVKLGLGESCPPEVTERVNIFTSRFFPIPILPQLHVQVVVVQNKTMSSMGAPLAFVTSHLQNAVLLFARGRTACFSTGGDPFLMLDAGADGELSPNEIAWKYALFWQTSSGAIGYTPRVLSGIPTQ